MSSRPQGGPECRTIEPVSPRVVARKSFVVSSSMVRRSPRPRPGRTSPSRPSWVGEALAAGVGRRAGVAGVPGRALQPSAPLPGAGAGRGGAPDLRAARADRLESRGGWPMSPRSRARTRRCTGCSGAPGSRAAAARAAGGGALPVAVPGPAAAHGHQEARQVRAARARRHRRPRPALAPGRLGVRALDRRRLQPAGLLRDPRRRDAPSPSPPSPSARSTCSSTTASSPSG